MGRGERMVEGKVVGDRGSENVNWERGGGGRGEGGGVGGGRGRWKGGDGDGRWRRT